MLRNEKKKHKLRAQASEARRTGKLEGSLRRAALAHAAPSMSRALVAGGGSDGRFIECRQAQMVQLPNGSIEWHNIT